MNRKTIIVIISVALVIGVITLIIYSVQRRDALKNAYLEDAVSLTVDQDTGETVVDDPNLTPHPDGNTGVTLLGLEGVVKQGILDGQLQFIKEELARFYSERLNDTYKTLTIRPQELTKTNSVITSKLRLGDSNILLPIEITAFNDGQTRLIIRDPSNQVGGDFDSGDVTFYGD